MKAMFIPISTTIMIISLLFSSCTANKKAQASTSAPAPDKVKKESTVSNPKKEDAVAVPKNNFSTRFPEAANVAWNKQSLSTDATTVTSYHVAFIEGDKKNWITYSAKGDVLEERQEILIDQLPQNIYNAIRVNYPTYRVASATTYKNTKKEGSYAVVLKPLSKFDTTETEVIFTENATLVE
jgi:glucose/arabinose dehydrogenase